MKWGKTVKTVKMFIYFWLKKLKFKTMKMPMKQSQALNAAPNLTERHQRSTK